MTRSHSIILTILCGALGCTIAQAQPPAPTGLQQHYTFEGGATGDWTAIGNTAKVTAATEPENVKEGQGSLRFDYAIAPGEFNAIFLPTPERGLVTTKSIRFWIKTDYAAPIAAVLQEQDGGRYVAMIAAPKATWQRVELAPSDFNLMDNADDPKDPDNKLDMDQVQGFGLGDFNQFLAAKADSPFVKLFGIKTGPHHLFLDDVELSQEVLAANVTPPDGAVLLDPLTRPHLSWLAIGGVNLSMVTDKILTGHSVQADYRQAQGTLTGIIKMVPIGKLAGLKQLSFDVASTKGATLLVQIEEKGGGKYNTSLQVPANGDVQKINLPFTGFKPSDDSKDADNKLDLDQVHNVMIIDVSSLLGTPDTDNTLFIGNLRATP